MFASILKSSPSRLSSLISPLIKRQALFSTSVTSSEEVDKPRLDRLFRKIRLEVRSNDRAVVDSYIRFTRMAAENLNIEFAGIDLISKKPHKSYKVERQICLRAAFVKKKHREQYEWRTYIKFVNFKHLTESTADTFLEYVERNLPEGCSMIVHKYEVIPMFDHLEPPIAEAVSGN